MKIKNHKLFNNNDEQVPFEATKNMGGKIKPLYLIIHYTAGSSADSSINWLKDPKAKASAHLVIGRDGTITQMVDFDKMAWHAGKSQWNNLNSLNGHSIGIELDNAGQLIRKNDGWRAWFRKEYPDNEVIVARHKHLVEESGWHDFTTEQIEACVEASAAIVNHYKLKDILGHEDISPFRKVDPGPAFPMASYKSKVMGRQQESEQIMETTTNLNIREGAGIQFAKLIDQPLPQQTKVVVLKYDRRWCFVEVQGVVNGQNDLQGWVHSAYLKEV